MRANDPRWKLSATQDYGEALRAARDLLDTLGVLGEGGFKAPHAPHMEAQARQKVIRLCGEITRAMK